MRGSYPRRNQLRARTAPRIGRFFGVPQQARVKLTYDVEYLITNPGPVTHLNQTSVTYRGVSARDPEYAIGGGSPTWWLRYASDYSFYQCESSSISVAVRPTKNWAVENLADFQDALHVYIVPWRSATVPDPDTLARLDGDNQGVVKKRVCKTNVFAPPTSRYQAVRLRMFRKRHAVVETPLSASDRYSSIGNDLPQDFFWHVVFALRPQLSDNIYTWNVRVRLNYYVKFLSRKYLFT